MKTPEVLDLGLLGYQEAWALQLQRVAERRAGTVEDALFLVEHPQAITLGRGTGIENLLDTDGWETFEVERGGDVTLHSPGQIVGYAIQLLEPGVRDLHAHLRRLEAFLMEVLARHGVTSRREPGATGVWVGDRKIASIGIACRHWVTFHGFALNVENDLEEFRSINPCGFSASVMTSMSREGARDAQVPAVKKTMTGLAAMLTPGRITMTPEENP